MRALPTLNKDVRGFHYAIVSGWLSITVLGFIYLVNQKLVEFDPNLEFSQLTAVDIVQQLPSKVRQANTIFHLIDESCACSVLGQSHRENINAQAKIDGFDIVKLSVSQSHIAPLIPSTPAILIIDDQQQLLYAGPYSTGLDCSADDSLIDTVLANYRLGFSSPTIISDASGCYCQR